MCDGWRKERRRDAGREHILDVCPTFHSLLLSHVLVHQLTEQPHNVHREMLVLCESPSRSVTHCPSCQPPGSYSFLIFLRALWSSPSVSSTANPLHCNPQMFHSLISLVLLSHPSRHYRCTHIFVITKSKPPAPTFLLRSGRGSPPDQVDSSV